MTQDEANQLRERIRQEVRVDISIWTIVGKMAKIEITSDQTPDGYLVWVTPGEDGEVQSLKSFLSYEEWQSYIDIYLE